MIPSLPPATVGRHAVGGGGCNLAGILSSLLFPVLVERMLSLKHSASTSVEKRRLVAPGLGTADPEMGWAHCLRLSLTSTASACLELTQ